MMALLFLSACGDATARQHCADQLFPKTMLPIMQCFTAQAILGANKIQVLPRRLQEIAIKKNEIKNKSGIPLVYTSPAMYYSASSDAGWSSLAARRAHNPK
ncbi:MAG: hypothetical protein ACOYNW_13710, partial [Undibacterium curvum]|uniref:hypothetical protein n=1 Tax=Undibacterium curvum TaxID=2762294 RepID=UPI003BEA4DF3